MNRSPRRSTATAAAKAGWAWAWRSSASIAQHHGGSVQAYSAGLGQGATVSLRVPLIPDGEALAEADGARHGEGPGAGTAPRRLLIVDDNIDAADSLAMLLRTLGHEVTTAHDGLRALQLIREQVPEVVLLDIGMPMLSGLEVAREVRSDPALAGVRLVAVSGYGQPLDKLAASQAGFHDHLVKPVDVQDVLEALRPSAEPTPPAAAAQGQR